MGLGRGPAAALAVELGGKGLAQDGLGDFTVGSGDQPFVNVSRGAFTLELDRGNGLIIVDYGNSVLDHLHQVVEQLGPVRVAGTARHLADQPGHAEFFCKDRPELETAFLESHGPEASRQHALAIGILVGGMVPGHQEFADRQQFAVGHVVGRQKAHAVFIVEHEPLRRFAFNFFGQPLPALVIPGDFNR